MSECDPALIPENFIKVSKPTQNLKQNQRHKSTSRDKFILGPEVLLEAVKPTKL